MRTIEIYDYHLQANQQDLFHIQELAIVPGEKVGFVAENGQGKTTLFKKIMAGDDERIRVRGSLAYLPQLFIDHDRSGGEKVKAELVRLFKGEEDCLLSQEHFQPFYRIVWTQLKCYHVFVK